MKQLGGYVHSSKDGRYNARYDGLVEGRCLHQMKRKLLDYEEYHNYTSTGNENKLDTMWKEADTKSALHTSLRQNARPQSPQRTGGAQGFFTGSCASPFLQATILIF